jgi:hypothetical protein
VVLLALTHLAAPAGFRGGRGIGRFLLFRALLRLLGPAWGTVAIVAVILALALGPQALRRRRR